MISSALFFYFHRESKHSPVGKKNYPSLQRKKDIVIKGFRFNGYHEGRQTITIKAAKFSIEKKKIGIFKFTLVRAAKFRDAEIDLFINEDLPGKNETTIKGLFSQETPLGSSLKGATSIIFKPVKINFRFANAPVTKIHASKATFDSSRQRIILKGQIIATAESNQLSTNRLMIYLEKGTFEIKNKFVLKTQSGQITGEKLITDFFLKKLG